MKNKKHIIDADNKFKFNHLAMQYDTPDPQTLVLINDDDNGEMITAI